MERLPARTCLKLTVANFTNYTGSRILAIPLQFCVFSRLQSLNVTMFLTQDPTRLIRRLLAENLDLRELALRLAPRFQGYTQAPCTDSILDAIFSTPLLDPKMHLRHLHTLRMHGLTISPEVVPIIVPFLRRVVNLDLDDMHDIAYSFWNALTEENIHCRAITIHNCLVGDAFLDYASSYVDTIQDISLSWDASAYEPSFGRYPMGRRFWMQVIGQHANSLRSLVVNALSLQDGGGWRMEEADMSSLAACPNLMHCDISCPTLIKGMVW
ncbi:hypothetical protein CPB85DRAFT_1438568 [Mucidula mucida]|nr:hypothetical protein CPB85DRAFT_1438568 [Mucidula mucida]